METESANTHPSSQQLDGKWVSWRGWWMLLVISCGLVL